MVGTVPRIGYNRGPGFREEAFETASDARRDLKPFKEHAMSPIASLLLTASLVVGADETAELPRTPAQFQQYLAGYWSYQLREEDLKAQVTGDVWEEKAEANNGQVAAPSEQELQAALAAEIPKLKKLRQGYLSQEIHYYPGDGKRIIISPRSEGQASVSFYYVRSFVESDGYTYLTVRGEGSRPWKYALYHGDILTDLSDDGKADPTDERQYRIVDGDHFQIVSVSSEVSQPTFIHTYQRVEPPDWARQAVARIEQAEAFQPQLEGHWAVEPREQDIREELLWKAWHAKNYESYTRADGAKRYRKKDWSAAGGKPTPPTEAEIQALIEKHGEEALEDRQGLALFEHLYLDALGTMLDFHIELLGGVEIEAEPYRVATERESSSPVEKDKFYLHRPKQNDPRPEIRVLDPDHIQLRTVTEPELGLPRTVITYRRLPGLPDWVSE